MGKGAFLHSSFFIFFRRILSLKAAENAMLYIIYLPQTLAFWIGRGNVLDAVAVQIPNMGKIKLNNCIFKLNLVRL
jgi:hypothetical protein